jgi:phage-related minor tail protein
MKKLLFTALLAGSALAAVPAAAQSVSGNVTVTGTVAAKCTSAGGQNGSINLGELAVADGKVNPTFSANVGGLSRSFTVTCTSANPQISVDATALVNSAIVTPTAGYTNTVHYTATMVASKAAGGTTSAIDTSNVAGATTALVGDHLANAPNNIVLTVSNGNTTTATDMLEAGDYSGVIALTVSPSA